MREGYDSQPISQVSQDYYPSSIPLTSQDVIENKDIEDDDSDSVPHYKGNYLSFNF